MLNTTYGCVDKEFVIKHFDKMIGKVFKILHLKEENSPTIDFYIKSLSRKFFGSSKIYFTEENLFIVGILNGIDFDNHETLRSDVFEIINVIEHIKKGL